MPWKSSAALMATVFEKYLRPSGHEWLICASSADEMDRLCAFAPDLLICPGVPLHRDSLELSADITGRAELRGVPVVLSTSLDDETARAIWDTPSLKSCWASASNFICLVDMFFGSQVSALSAR